MDTPDPQYPRGQLHDGDDGATLMAVGVDEANGIIIVDFGKPLIWVGLPPAEARAFAETLMQRADEIEAKQKGIPCRKLN